ncbi:MAG: TonB-dependent receptor plug domain-containing protein, partial [Pseudomonadota bacterium]
MSRVELDDVRGAALRPLGVWGTVALVLCTTGALPARAAPPGGPSAAPSTLPPVEVVAPAPLPGGAVPTAWLPTNVQSASGADLARAQATNLGEFHDAAFAGVHAASSQSNPFQLDLAFRGIGVSPLLGSANGLAVLVDGVRVNESFGDVVLWDLVPTFAIDTVQLVPGASPAFGPNALGGSLLVRSRSGRTSPGLGAALAGGSFGRERAELTYGGTRGAFDAFVGAGYGAEDGWRDRSPTEVRQFHAQGGWSGDDARLSASYTRAANRLAGNGLAPEALLAADPDAVYTWPDVSRPELDFGRLAAEWRVGDVALDAHAYLRRLDLGTENGDVEFDDGDTPADASDDG